MSETPQETPPASKSQVAGFFDSYIKPLGAFAFMATLCGLAYNVGLTAGTNGLKEAVDRERNEGLVRIIAAQQESSRKVPAVGICASGCRRPERRGSKSASCADHH